MGLLSFVLGFYFLITTLSDDCLAKIEMDLNLPKNNIQQNGQTNDNSTQYYLPLSSEWILANIIRWSLMLKCKKKLLRSIDPIWIDQIPSNEIWDDLPSNECPDHNNILDI